MQDEGYFQREVEPHLDGDRITYVGNVGPAERDRLMGGALALLHPIGFAEPFGLSVAEAMMTGAPVIAFNLGSMPELIEEGRTGFLVGDVAEAVSAVRKIPGLMRGYVAERARKRFSVARMVEGYLEVYSKLTNPDSFRG